MAASCTRRTLQVSTAYATRTAISNIFRSSQSLGAAQLLGCASRKTSSASRISLRRLLTSSRFPVELAAALSLMPLHSANASALYTSLLSLHSDNWGCLSEDGYEVFSIKRVITTLFRLGQKSLRIIALFLLTLSLILLVAAGFATPL